MGYPLSQTDRNLLVEQKEATLEQNGLLGDANKSVRVDVAKNLLIDVPFKKQTDDSHFQIAMYEEELRRLDGTSIPQPLQEQGFILTDSVADARLYVNDGRLKITENSTEILNIPIIPWRGYSLSQPCGTDFDIWSRDRFGSSTSMPNTGSVFTVSNSRLRVRINGEEQEVDLSGIFSLPQDLSGGMIGSSFQGLFQGIEVGSAISANSEPYSIIEGNTIDISVDGGVNQTATFTGPDTSVTTINAEKFAMQDLDSLSISIDGSTSQTAVFQTTTKAFCQNSATEYYLTDGSTLSISVDGGTAQTATFYTGDFSDINKATASEVVIVLNRFWTGVAVSTTSDATVRIEHELAGTQHFFQITDGNLKPNLTLNFPIDVVAVDPLIEMTAQEVCDTLNSQWIGITASTAGVNVILTVDASGIHNLSFSDINGTPLSELGFPETYGFFTAQQIVDVLSTSWTGITATTSDENGETGTTNVKIALNATNKFQITDGTGSPNLVIGLSQHLILAVSGFQSCGFNFDETNFLFTIASGISGPSSSVEVLPATINDIATDINFLPSQYMIQGKYANNLLNVEIDGVPAEIKIGDFRKCDVDASRGEVNDDYSFLWSGAGKQLGYQGTTRMGPLFCYQSNDGKDVAMSIQSQLRAVGSGGFKDAKCAWYSDDGTFIIYSGTFGTTSSVKILVASDPNRDARQFLGYLTPAEEKGNEQYYDTLGSLTTFLSGFPNITISGLSDANRVSHSILYFRGIGLNGVKIYDGWQTFIVPTTKIYDDGSRGRPRLYPDGTLVIDDTNDMICFAELTRRELTAQIEHGKLTAGDVAIVVQNALNASAEINTYTVSYINRTKQFVISSTGVVQFLWKTGRYSVKSIGNQIGFDVSVDTSFATSHTSNVVEYTNSDYYNPVYLSQLYGWPLTDDKTVDEESALLTEEDTLKSEQQDSGLLDWIKNTTIYDNEFALESWEWLASIEYAKVQQEYDALLKQLGAYSNHISESDAETARKITARNNLLPNKTNLDILQPTHGKIVNLVMGNTQTYIAGVDFTSGGAEPLVLTIPVNEKVYNKPSPLVVYETIPTKHLSGDFSPSGLFTNSVTFTKRSTPAFSITNIMVGTAGYSFSDTTPSGSFTIPASSQATDICLNSEPYDMSSGNDTLKMKINNGAEQTATFDATSGYTESRIASTSGFVIESGTNNLIRIDEGSTFGFTDSVVQTYNLTGDSAGFTDSVVETYNLTNGDQLQISVNGGLAQIATFNTADFVNIAIATASEIAVVFNTDWSGVTASVVGGKVRITHDTVGLSNTFQISDGIGNPNVQLGFSTSLISGTNSDQLQISVNGGLPQIATFNTADFVNISVATASEIVVVLNTDWSGVTASVVSGKVRITHDTVGSSTFQITDGAGNPNVQLGFATSLISGTDGIKNVYLGAGAYIGTALASEIQTKINLAGDSNYTVDYGVSASNRFTIFSDLSGGTGIFSILWSFSTADYVLGFNNTDDTGVWTYTSDNNVNFAVQTNVNDAFTVRINGILSAGDIIITQGLYTSASLVTEIETQIAVYFAPADFSVNYTSNKFRITSTRKGTTSTVEVYEKSGRDFLQTVALDGDVPIVGGGDVGDISAVTATEVVNVLIAEITGITALVETNMVRIKTNLYGSRAKIEITGGTAQAVLGFSGTVYGKDAQNLLKVDIDGDTTQIPIVLNAGTILGTVLAADIQTKLRALLPPIPENGYTDCVCTWNETARWTTFTDQLRIESGRRGTASSVEVTNFVLEINSTNNKIDFIHDSGGFILQHTVTLTSGFYNPPDLATEVQTQLNSVGSFCLSHIHAPMTFSVSYNISTGRMEFTGDENFSFKWLTGTNNAVCAYYVLGFNKADTLYGSATNGEYEVLDQNAWEALKFDAQTLEPGHDLTSVLLSITDTNLTTRLYWTDNGGGNRADLNIDLTTPPNDTVLGLMATINADPFYSCDYSNAFLQARVSAKYRVEYGDTLIVSANGGADQTFTFNAQHSISESGIRPQTRVYSGVNDRLKIDINGVSSETVVTNEIAVASASAGQTTFTLANNPIKSTSTSGVITRTVIQPFPIPPIITTIPIAEGVDYVVYSSGMVVLSLPLVLGDEVKMNYTWLSWTSGLYEVILGTQMTETDIANKIQQEVREIQIVDQEDRAVFLGFTCQYINGKYALKTGVGGNTMSIKVYDGSINSAAPSLKLGTSYGGTETAGSGFCANSGYATVGEISAFINGTAIDDLVAEGTDYLRLRSGLIDPTCRITVNSSSTLYEKWGFDNNDDSYPFSEIPSIPSSMLLDVTDVEIMYVTYSDIFIGWSTDKGNVILTYAKIDNSMIDPRKAIVATRLTTILPRKPQIPIRTAEILSALTPTLYQERIDGVQLRLNKRTGSYIKVGDKYNEIEQNDNSITANTTYSNAIDGLLI